MKHTMHVCCETFKFVFFMLAAIPLLLNPVSSGIQVLLDCHLS